MNKNLESIGFINLKTTALFLLALALCISAFSIQEVHAQDEPLECSVLDDFNNTTELDPPVILTPEAPGPVNILDDGSPGVLGSFRNIVFGPRAGVLNSTILIQGNLFSLSNDVSTVSPVSILYNANGSGLDADLSNVISLQLLFINNDLPDTTANLVITDSENNEANFFIPNLPNNQQDAEFPLEVIFPLAEFNGIQNLDLSNIESIELEIEPTGFNTDLTFGDFDICRPPTRDIPTLSEWGLIAMAGLLGIVGFMVMRRRKVAA